MRLRTQLFLYTGILVLLLVGIHALLQVMQLRKMEEELAQVVTRVSQSFLTSKANIKAKKIEVITTLTEKDIRETPADGKTRAHTQEETEIIWHRDENDDALTMSLDDDTIRIHRIQTQGQPVLLIRGMPDGDVRIPIPVSRSTRIINATLQTGILAGIVLLLSGLVYAVFFSHRITRPLRSLTKSAEALGRGEWHTRVKENSKGEIGELQHTFNRMAGQLLRLEQEKEAWKAREHLAELGALARGLAHTVRNPLNTLGLTLEELNRLSGGKQTGLVSDARNQIRRIDRWLRSFLAIGANGAVSAETIDLATMLDGLILEMIQAGADIAPTYQERPAVHAISHSLRAALANILENAVQASPAEHPVDVVLSQQGAEALVRIKDQGPGLPNEVRERLFQPHVTTKPGGSGMGIFLAKQILEGMGGAIAIRDSQPQGTEVEIRLPIDQQETADDTV